MTATISADIVSSTTLSVEETFELKQRIEKLFSILEKKYSGFWGRLIKGDYIECVIPDAKDAFRIALIIKTCIKSYPVKDAKEKKSFISWGVRISIGIGEMRIIDKEAGIMDGEAIYLSGRNLTSLSNSNKGTLVIDINNPALQSTLQVIGTLTDAIVNSDTRRQCDVLFYKLLSYSESEIANQLGIKQAGVNQHSTSAKWYSIEEAINYYEKINFD